ncbi:MAG: gamma-glutamyl-gamma-aminobutyrate hydrolase family protein [Bacteroidota bacterium]
MKKLIFTIIWLTALLFCPSLANSQDYFDHIKKEGEDNKILVLTHPTVSNLKTFATLVEEGLVDLPDYRFVGVFYDKERYDFSETKKFLDTASTLPVDFSLHRIEDTLSKNELFTNNSLTDDFEKIFNNSEGIIFFGGPDLPPSTYKEKTNLLTSIYDPHRHYFELSFLFHLIGGKQNTEYNSLLSQNSSYLIYGFCLGM